MSVLYARGNFHTFSYSAGRVHRSEESGAWTLQASIFPENAASIAIHESCGFREVGYRERISTFHGRWRDTVITERRSKVVGV